MPFWFIGTVAFAGTVASAPFVRQVLIRFNILDLPNDRSSHVAPTPRGGGIACTIGVVAGLVAALLTGQVVPLNVLLAAFLVGLVGLLDDRFGLNPIPRLITQIAVGAALGAVVGGLLWALVGVILVPALVNIVNFMDGINGITSISIALWAGFAIHEGIQHNARPFATLAVITAGAVIGFLPWNALRAKLFLGDVGSYMLGTLVAGSIIQGGHSGVPLDLLLAPLAIYIADVATTLVRRAVRRAPLLQSHREHTYQKIQTLLQSHVLTSLIVVAFSALVAVTYHTPWAPWRYLAPLSLIFIYLALPSIIDFTRDRYGHRHGSLRGRP